MTYTEMSTENAISALKALSPTAYREDHALVMCESLTENYRIVDLAKKALTRGYVNRVVDATKVGDLRVIIIFRKPPFLELTAVPET